MSDEVIHPGIHVALLDGFPENAQELLVNHPRQLLFRKIGESLNDLEKKILQQLGLLLGIQGLNWITHFDQHLLHLVYSEFLLLIILVLKGSTPHINPSDVHDEHLIVTVNVVLAQLEPDGESLLLLLVVVRAEELKALLFLPEAADDLVDVITAIRRLH